MPTTNVRGVAINYEIVGTHGPWLALMPGGRRGYAEFVPLANKIASGGFRVLLHDRRNTGASEVAFHDSDAEDAIWAQDLHALLTQLDALPAFVGGSSSGCRTSLLLYLRHRRDVQGLLLFRVTGGPFAAERLPENYYRQFIRAAEQGGMDAVVGMEHWRERIEARAANAGVLRRTSAARFIEVMEKWHDDFMRGVDMPVLGVSEQELRSIDVPTIVIPGNDKIHSGPAGRRAHSLVPGAVLHELPIEDTDRELVPYEEWAPNEDEIAAAFIDFMRGARKPERKSA
jgi:pimeloyl-ACP methyl ester carboxylesterase